MISALLTKITSSIFSKKEDIILPSEYLKKFFNEIDNSNSNQIEHDNFITLESQRIIDYIDHTRVDINTKALREIEKLRHELYHDDLTAIFNKKYLTSYIISNNGEFQREGTLVFIDLNKFKEINDKYGHVIGDNALEVFSAFLSNNLRKNDKVIRYAGDEFIILFDTKNFEAILTKMKILSQKLSTILVGVNDDTHINLQFSFGIQPFEKEDNAKEIITLADSAMYRHKARQKKSENH